MQILTLTITTTIDLTPHLRDLTMEALIQTHMVEDSIQVDKASMEEAIKDSMEEAKVLTEEDKALTAEDKASMREDKDLTQEVIKDSDHVCVSLFRIIKG